MMEPPVPIVKGMYLCDNRFYTETIAPLFADQEMFTLICMRGEECSIWSISAQTKKCLKRFRPDLPNHHRRGGQSQNRLMRIREQTHDAYVNAVAEWVRVSAADEKEHARKKPLLLAGCSTKPLQLKEQLQAKGFKVMETFIVQDDDDAIAKVQTFLAETKEWDHELQMWEPVQKEFDLLRRGLPSRVMYGTEEVLEHLRTQQTDVCFIHDSLDHHNLLAELSADDRARVTILHKPHHPILEMCGGIAGLKYF